MPIISSEVWKVRDRGNGRLAVYEKHTDHNGDIHEHRYSAPVGHDTDQALSEWATSLEATLIDIEKGETKEKIKNGTTPSDLDIKHLSTAEVDEQIIISLMTGAPSDVVEAAQYVALLSNKQIEGIFGADLRKEVRDREKYIIKNI